MGVYVPGMEIPSNCEKCDFLVHIGLDKYRCKRTGKEFYSWEVGWGSEPRIRLADCPLIEVPAPHGRLIDDHEVRTRMIGLSFSVQTWISEVELSNVPTVIEREDA